MMRVGLLLLTLAALGAGIYFVGFGGPVVPPPPTQPAELVVLSFGGTFTDAQRAAYFQPFQAETAIRINEATYGGEYGRLKSAVQSGEVPDIADVEASALARGLKENLFVPIDYSIVDKTNLIPEAVHTHAVGTDIYSVALGYHPPKIPAGTPPPSTWADFWDVAKYPGPRSLKKDPRFTLEIALMADGVAPADLYKNGQLDVDRAFRKLDQIKPHVKVWWSSGQQPVQLLGDGEVVMAAAFGARLWIAQHRESRPVGLTWNQGILDIEYWAVLKGARHPQASMKFIAFATQPQHQKTFSTAFPLGPVNTKTFDLLPPDVAKNLNTHPDNLSRQTFLNVPWWAENEDKIIERFNQWLSK